jgi:dihydrodipicolinate synthase/N-acetylneuraminate lyase
MVPQLKGVFAALVTPLDEEGSINYEGIDEVVDFVASRGVHGICFGGAASEYAHFDLSERKQAISRAGKAIQGRGVFLSAIGCSCFSRLVDLGRHAGEAGCAAVLIPAPHFYRYDQRDLETFFRKAFSVVSTPCVLYDLPMFTNTLELDTVLRLLLTAQNLVGLKDSSGNVKGLTRLAQAREQSDFFLLIGDDRLLLPSWTAGWDGCISGIACLCPELVVKEYESFRAGDRDAAHVCQALVDELAAEVQKFPFPWGLRIGLSVRGVPTGPLPMPLSPFRRQQVGQFRDWFARWLETHPEVFS